MDDSRIDLILMLLREGSAQHAIKVFEEEAGVGYFMARRAVRDLARRHGIRANESRATVLSLTLIALAGLLGLRLIS
ncbi:MAG: hypothetical protein FJ276_27430 [Planctomycetes bacterium]|nr:hypothetical protein [Planctomycetota bacterium]